MVNYYFWELLGKDNPSRVLYQGFISLHGVFDLWSTIPLRFFDGILIPRRATVQVLKYNNMAAQASLDYQPIWTPKQVIRTAAYRYQLSSQLSISQERPEPKSTDSRQKQLINRRPKKHTLCYRYQYQIRIPSIFLIIPAWDSVSDLHFLQHVVDSVYI